MRRSLSFKMALKAETVGLHAGGEREQNGFGVPRERQK